MDKSALAAKCLADIGFACVRATQIDDLHPGLSRRERSERSALTVRGLIWRIEPPAHRKRYGTE